MAGGGSPERPPARRDRPRRLHAGQHQLPGHGRRADEPRCLPSRGRSITHARRRPGGRQPGQPASGRRRRPHPARDLPELPGSAGRGRPPPGTGGRRLPAAPHRLCRRGAVIGVVGGRQGNLRVCSERNVRDDRDPPCRGPGVRPRPPPPRSEHGLHQGDQPRDGRAGRARRDWHSRHHALLPVPGVHARLRLRHPRRRPPTRRRAAHVRVGRYARHVADPRQGRPPTAAPPRHRHAPRRGRGRRGATGRAVAGSVRRPHQGGTAAAPRPQVRPQGRLRR